MNRLFAIPDIHGRSDLLDEIMHGLWQNCGLNFAKDKLIFLGDMIDRGPDSKGVIDRIRSLTLACPGRVIALRGNHEQLCLDAYAEKKRDDDSDKWELWMWNGGDTTIESYSSKDVPEPDREWIASLPLFHEEPGFFFSHAPVPSEGHRALGLKGKPFSDAELMWTYSADEVGVARRHGNGIVGVCGHIHALRRGLREPRLYDHYIYADAGCGCHPAAPLVAIEVKSRAVFAAIPEGEW